MDMCHMSTSRFPCIDTCEKCHGGAEIGGHEKWWRCVLDAIKLLQTLLFVHGMRGGVLVHPWHMIMWAYCLVTCSSGFGKWRRHTRGLNVGIIPWVPVLGSQGKRPRFDLRWMYLVMELPIWELRLSSGWKLKNSWSGDGNGYAQFACWRRGFWRTFIVVCVLSLVVDSCAAVLSD
jgi:hypothetical protein